MTPSSSASRQSRAALGAGVACYLMWGFIPLLFQQMARLGADAWEIMANRMVWGLMFAALLVMLSRQWGQVRAVFRSPKLFAWLLASAVLIAVNWTVYVMAVNGGRALESSLGYYLNPLLNMAAGAWLFRERIDRYGAAAIGLAGIGVALQALALGHLPWVSLVLAFSFCGYGIIRKRVAVEAQTGLFTECLILALPALIWMVFIQSTGQGHLFTRLDATAWLMFAGPATVIPLALFAWAARRMPLSHMGFIQFLAPSIVFVIGVLQGEALGSLRIVSFVFIWTGAAIFAVGAVLKVRAGSRTAETVVAPEPGLIDDPAEVRMHDGGR